MALVFCNLLPKEQDFLPSPSPLKTDRLLIKLSNLKLNCLWSQPDGKPWTILTATEALEIRPTQFNTVTDNIGLRKPDIGNS